MAKTQSIRLLTSVASTEYTYSAGQVVVAPEEIANDLIRGGHAVPADTERKASAENANSRQANAAEKR